jgi:hypothetical protein
MLKQSFFWGHFTKLLLLTPIPYTVIYSYFVYSPFIYHHYAYTVILLTVIL